VIPTSKKILSFALVLIASVMLGACSSKPSPWAEASSPWDNKEETSQEPEPLEIADIEPVEPVQVEDTIEPIDAEPVIDEPVFEEAAVVEPEPEPVTDEPVLAASGEGLSGQPAGYYAVQVVASGSMEQLTDFASAHQISDQWVAETTVDGRVWYVLMLGVYPSKEEAEQAMQSVMDLETLPWVRTIASIQSVMN